ncbi:dihydropteroate synthase [Desulfovibrio aminophilus]|uniref:dihydropteroate synthase n=1 Tax=Desulfovibrio aminophilus TaxID=81425 RepID=UPI0004178B8E|nr:dihydropteroate synthase [Desulfovibrio aminophilus]
MRENSWSIKGGKVLGPAPFFIAGIVNVTPDSFHDGGRWFDTRAAVAHGRELAAQGAHILDVGGESTRPGAAEVSEDEELRRVLPVIAELATLPRAALPDCSGEYPVLSVDTFKARVAAESLAAGAGIVNDISACRFDEALADVLAQEKPGYVLMHSQGRPRVMQKAPAYGDVVEEVLAFFEERLQYLCGRGLPEDRIVLDPGIGFGKTLEHNLRLLREIKRFESLGRPVYMGLSNKSLFQGLLGLEPGRRGTATQVATAVLAAKGVAVHRVHDVAETVRTLRLAAAMA